MGSIPNVNAAEYINARMVLSNPIGVNKKPTVPKTIKTNKTLIIDSASSLPGLEFQNPLLSLKIRTLN